MSKLPELFSLLFANATRDENSTLELYDFQQQGADVDMTLDTRLVSQEGRQDIAKDIKTNSVGIEAIADVVTQDTVEIGDTFSHLQTKLNYLNAANTFAAENPELAQILNNPDATPAQKEAAYNAYVNTIAKTFGIDRDEAVKLMATNARTQEGEEIKGAHVDGGENQGDIYVNDVTNANAMEVANTLGHEATHYIEDNSQLIRNRGDAGNEAYANLMGSASADYLNFAYGNTGLGGLSTGNSNNHVGTIQIGPSMVAANTRDFMSAQANGNVEYHSINTLDGFTATQQARMALADVGVPIGTSAGNQYTIIKNIDVNDPNQEAIYYSAYNDETGNTIHLDTNELSSFLALEQQNSYYNEASEGVPNYNHLANSAITEMFAGRETLSNFASSIGTSWVNFGASGDMALELIGGAGLGFARSGVGREAFEGVSGLNVFSRASEFGIKPYSPLAKEIQGTGLQAHHVIEQRFATRLGLDPKSMQSIALTPAEHQAFTNAWRQTIPYGPNGTGRVTRENVIEAAQGIYQDYPQILNALGF